MVNQLCHYHEFFHSLLNLSTPMCFQHVWISAEFLFYPTGSKPSAQDASSKVKPSFQYFHFVGNYYQDQVSQDLESFESSSLCLVHEFEPRKILLSLGTFLCSEISTVPGKDLCQTNSEPQGCNAQLKNSVKNSSVLELKHKYVF